MDIYKRAPGVFWLAAAVLAAAAAAVYSLDSTRIPTADPKSEETASPKPPIQDPADIEAAVQKWESLLAEDSLNAQAHYRLGLLLAVADREAAPAHLEQAKSLDPALEGAADQMLASLRRANFFDDPAYQFILIGQTLGGLGEWALAEAAFTHSTQADPSYAEAWAYLGEARQQTGEDGLAALETAIRLNPESPAANLFFNLYWRRQERPDLALSYAQTALGLDPDNFSLIETLARTHAENGNFTEAVNQMLRLTELAPDDPGAWLAAAEFCLAYEVQMEETGIPAARQAVILSPGNPAPLVLLGRAYLLLGDDFYAQRFLDQALELDPDNAPAHLAMGILWVNREDFEQALLHLQTASTLGVGTPAGDQADTILDKYYP